MNMSRQKVCRILVVIVMLVLCLYPVTGCSAKNKSLSWQLTGDQEAIQIIENIKKSAGKIASFEADVMMKSAKMTIVQHWACKVPFKVCEEGKIGATTRITLTDGKTFWTYDSSYNRAIKGKVLKKGKVRREALFCESNAIFFLYSVLGVKGGIKIYLSQDAIVKLLGSETIDSKETKVVKVSPLKPGILRTYLKIWVDTERWVPLKCETFYEKGDKSLGPVFYKDYVLFQGKLWLFKRAELGLASGKLNTTVTWSNLKLNHDIPDSVFRFKVPAGATVKEEQF